MHHKILCITLIIILVFSSALISFAGASTDDSVFCPECGQSMLILSSEELEPSNYFTCSVCGCVFNSLGDVSVHGMPPVDENQNILDAIANLPTTILNFLRELFIPSSESINNIISRMSDEFCLTFGVSSFDLSGMVGPDTRIDDYNHSADNYLGFDISNTPFINTSYLYSAISTFRPYIRGLLVILLIFYNLNQYFNFTGLGSATLGAYERSKN